MTALLTAGQVARPGRASAVGWLSLPTLAIAAVVGWLAWLGWASLASYGPLREIRASQAELVGPVVLGFVAVVTVLEQLWPAQRRPVLARGHLVDLGYLVTHAVVVLPVVVLIGDGFSSLLARHAQWLVLPRFAGVPRWGFVAIALVAIDFVDWFAHLLNHKLSSLWRLHALHHSQEELSVLTTYRTHPLVHVTFVLTAIPVLALAHNDATPAMLLTAYACLGALPHANLRWSYGPFNKVVVSPAYHRAHHRPTGRLDINLATVFSIWDVATGRAVLPSPREVAPPTGLSGRPIPVEQDPVGSRSLLRVFVRQWIEPFRAGPTTGTPTTREMR